MQKILNSAFALSFVVLLAACGGGKADNSDLGKKKAELEKLQNEQRTLNDKISKLEDEIAKIDTSAEAQKKMKLVSVQAIGTDSFSHFIDLQGKIDAQNVAMVAPKGQGGVVKSINVRQGQSIRKGQLILSLENAVANQQVETARAAVSAAESNASLAKSVYERRENLWKQNIGTEVSVLEAKTNYENANAAVEQAKSGLRVAQESAGYGNVYAEISGTIDVVNVRVGEFFSPQTAANPASGIRIVNTGDLRVLVQVPENYLDRVNVGSSLRVTVPELNNRVIETKVTVASRLIDPVSRTFFIEGKIPQDKAFRPNQIARVQILDYRNNAAITIPVNTLQSDEKGKYVLVAVKEADKLVARKKTITVGELYGDRLEVKSGLAAGDQVITEGFQSLYEGQLITTQAK